MLKVIISEHYYPWHLICKSNIIQALFLRKYFQVFNKLFDADTIRNRPLKIIITCHIREGGYPEIYAHKID